MALYQLTSNSLAANAQPIAREADGAHIPNDPLTADYQQYLAWLAVPNIPDPAPVPILSPAQQMVAAFSAGCQILSQGANSTLNGTYDAAGPVWQNMKDEAQYIATFGAFSGGVSTLVWVGSFGTITFSTTTQFMLVVRTVGDWLTGWNRFVVGQLQNAPTLPVSIT